MNVIYITKFIHITVGIERGLTTGANYLVEKCNYEVVIFNINNSTLYPFINLTPKLN